MHLASRCSLLQPSATMAIAASVRDRIGRGEVVYDLGVGEPDFPTPEHICQAAIAAIGRGATKYTASGGVARLRSAIVDRSSARYGLPFQLSHVTCANGAKQVLYNLFQVLLNPGDDVLCFSPAWVSYRPQVELAGGNLVEIPLDPEQGFPFDPERLTRAVTPRTVAILLNSPCNPTGRVLSTSDLDAIATFARKHQLVVISDDVYDHFYYGPVEPAHILNVAPDLRERVVAVNAVSKTYAMTGWRLGYALGPQEIIAKMEDLQSHSASNPSAISQEAAIEALSGPQDSVVSMRAAFRERRDFLLRCLADWPGIVAPEGAFYLMLDIRQRLLPGEQDNDFCHALLEQTGVATVPGSSFGAAGSGFIRLSFACPLSTLSAAADILRMFRSR